MNLALFYFILLIIGVIVAGFLITKMRIWKPKRMFWLSAIYFGCGLFAFVYLLFLSSNVEKVVSDQVLQKHIVENEQLMMDLKNREFDSLKEEHLKFTKTFEATAEDIEILRNEDSYYLPVFISWIDSTENKIIASYYETPLYLNRVNISPYVEVPRIEWNENKLYIVETETKVTAKSLRFSSEILDQNDIHRFGDPLDELIGHRILHLNVPKQFNIIDKDGWL